MMNLLKIYFVLQRLINFGRDSVWAKSVKINETV
jgi:hypothetical protein